MIRLYGLDCDQVKNVLPHAKKHNIKLFVGIYEVDRLDDEVNTLAGIMNGDWTIVDTVSVGNEFVLTGKKSVGDMVALTNQARDLLRGKGYQGPVVTVEVFYKYLEDPALCDGSDYIAANAHPYFDGNVAPENCGEFLVEMSRQIKEKCGGQKEVMIVETGWPTQGGINKSAVPGKDNQKKAIESIEKAFGEKVILFTAFNDLWKADNPSTNGVERVSSFMP